MPQTTLLVSSCWVHQRGATMVEYGLLLALISLAVMATVTAIGLTIDKDFRVICQTLNHGQACNL